METARLAPRKKEGIPKKKLEKDLAQKPKSGSNKRECIVVVDGKLAIVNK